MHSPRVVGDVWRSMKALRGSGGAMFLWCCAAILSAAHANPQSPYPDGLVVAHSRFGNGTIRAPVRSTTMGWEVLLPGGRWVYCRRSCAETLRVETIDFFNANGAGTGQLTNECGIFGCLDLKYPR